MIGLSILQNMINLIILIICQMIDASLGMDTQATGLGLCRTRTFILTSDTYQYTMPTGNHNIKINKNVQICKIKTILKINI